MATRTIARMFDSYDDAVAAVNELESNGFAQGDISLIANRGTGAGTTTGTLGTTATSPVRAGDADTERHGSTGAGSGAGTGASIGTIVGGGAGLLAGLGALAIPGLGPVVAAGWLAATLTGAGVGAAAGGVLGGLTGAGIGEEHAHVYAEGLRRGGNLVTVRTDDSRAAMAESILMRHNAVDVDQRAGEYRSGSWTGYDPAVDQGLPTSRSARDTML